MINKINEIISKKGERSKNFLKNVIYSFGIKGLAMFISLFTMPAYIRYFDSNTVLGIWYTAISILTWIMTFDLGIGNGLRNYLVKPLVENNKKEIKTYISSSYITILIISIIIGILGYIIIPNVPWNNIFNISKEIVNQDILIFMVTALFIGVIINFILNLIKPIYYALQKSAVPSLLTLCSNILMLLYVLLAKTDNLEYNIKSLSIVFVFTQNIPYLIASIVIFFTKLKGAFPSIKYYSKEYSKKIVKLGTAFLYLQILTMVIFGTNEFLITHWINPEDVVEFQVYNKLFTIIATLFNLALTPVWSAVREACVKKDISWINSLKKKLNLSLILVIPCEIILVCLSQFIVNIWLRENAIEINYIYAIIYAIYNTIYMKVTIDASLIGGLGKLNVQAISMTVTTFLKLVITFLLIKIYNNWIVIIIGNIIALGPYIVIEYFDINRQIKKLGE